MLDLRRETLDGRDILVEREAPGRDIPHPDQKRLVCYAFPPLLNLFCEEELSVHGIKTERAVELLVILDPSLAAQHAH